MPETPAPPEPTQVRLPLIRVVPYEDKMLFMVAGSVVVPIGAAQGQYLGTNGYTSDPDLAQDFALHGGSVTVESPGAPGKSAYELWLTDGHEGSLQDYFAWLKGAQGEPGPRGLSGVDGADGPPGERGLTGAKGDPGNPGERGLAGVNGINGTNGAKGDKGDPGSNGTNGAKGDKGDPGANGTNGTNGAKGDPGSTKIGTVSLGQTATIAIALGLREITVALTGAVKGDPYKAYCRSYKLNGGTSSQIGRPINYAIVDCVSNTNGQITVTINAPLLSIGQAYELVCDIVRDNY